MSKDSRPTYVDTPCFIVPMFATIPLLKVPILFGHAICTYHGMTPPKVAPLPRDRLSTGPDFLRWMPDLQKAGTRFAKVGNSLQT